MGKFRNQKIATELRILSSGCLFIEMNYNKNVILFGCRPHLSSSDPSKQSSSLSQNHSGRIHLELSGQSTEPDKHFRGGRTVAKI